MLSDCFIMSITKGIAQLSCSIFSTLAAIGSALPHVERQAYRSDSLLLIVFDVPDSDCHE